MPRGEDQTSIAMLVDEKKVLEEAKQHYQQAQGRTLSSGQFVKLLAEEYLGRHGKRGVIKAQQVEEVNATPVPPGQTVYMIYCPVCGGSISWPIGLRSGYCPYCKGFLSYG